MILRLSAGLVLIWALGFALFAVALPRQPAEGRTDAIVVLTGGPGRVERGLAPLKRGLARRLLISGVGRAVRKVDLAERYPAYAGTFACCVDLGREAVDTRSNAEETARWIAAGRYRSMRLVTTDWHMPRARFEIGNALRRAGLGVTILPDPVPSRPALGQLVREFNKYLLRRAAVLAGR